MTVVTTSAAMSAFRAARFATLLLLPLAAISTSGSAMAQSEECQKLGKLMQARGGLIAKVQSFQKKEPTAPVACAAFNELAANTSSVISELETNGSWCHAPPEALAAMESQKTQIASARTSACNAAAQQKKMMEQQAKQQQQQQQQLKGAGPIGGGGDVLGGPIKVPQGAL